MIPILMIVNRNFEEYKLFRDTAKNFDQILLDIRKSTITLAFILFGAAAETLRIPSSKSKYDLAIVIVLIELLMVLTFYYLENHYRQYLVNIVTIAAEYENKLNLGIELNKCQFSDKGECDIYDNKKVGISKCLKCMHDRKMDFFSQIAHFNIYATLLNIGFVALNVLILLKIGLYPKEIIVYSIIIGIITFGSTILFGLRNIKKQYDISKRKAVIFDDTLFVYLSSIISFGALIYIFYNSNKILDFLNLNINIRFALSFSYALIISSIFFIVLILFELDSKKQYDKTKQKDVTLSVYLLSIISFGALIYIFYYSTKISGSLNPTINIKFALSFFCALIISIIFFIVLGLNRKKINEKLKKILINLKIMPEN